MYLNIPFSGYNLITKEKLDLTSMQCVKADLCPFRGEIQNI